MAGNNNKHDSDDFVKKNIRDRNWDNANPPRPSNEDRIVDTLKPPPRIPDNQDKPDES